MNKSLDAKRLPPGWLTMSALGDVRIGPVLSIPAVLTELGVRPQLAFSQAGIDPELFQNLDSRVRYDAVARLLDVCAALTGCPHFGLLVGERFELKSLGAVGYLMRNSATVGDALRSLVRYLHLYDRGAAPVLLAPDSSFVTLGYSVYRHDTPAATQVYDVVMAIAYRMVRELCGPLWKPVRVQFSHGRPRSAAPYRRVFRSPVSFDAGISGIVFASSWLRRPIEGADGALHAILANAIRAAEANGPMSFGDQVQGALYQLVLNGTASAGAVAHLFAIHERTLRRRLAEEGTGLHQLVNRTRFELAQQLLRNTGLPVSEIAAALQYADPNAFSRAFRNWAKLSPTQWRARH